ncbi:hypothetical protein [Acinetobacter sp.]|uniref:hypothetical protein n=1 Tax=Acinetobacter sp. TaxID=472 RepID=UPI003753AF41
MSHTKINELNFDLSSVTATQLQPLAYSPELFSLVTGISIASLSRDRETGCMGGIPFRESGGRILYPRATAEEWLLKDLKRGDHKYLPPVSLGDTRGRGRPKGTTKAELANRKKRIEPPPITPTLKNSVSAMGGDSALR